VIAALALGIAVAAAPATPTYVVERVVRTGGEMRRTSVFRDGIAVAVREKDGVRTSFVRRPLTEIELQVIVQVAEEAYPDLERLAAPPGGAGLGSVELRLAPPGREPLTVRVAAGSVPVLGAARLGQALDNLEAEMGRLQGAREDLRGWQPRVGERVELDDGRTVLVLEVLGSPNGNVLRLQIGDGPTSIFMGEGELRRVAVRRVAR